MEPQLTAIAKQRLSFSLHGITKEVVSECLSDIKSLYTIDPIMEDQASLTYDTVQLNQIVYDTLTILDERLRLEVQEDQGFLYEVPLGLFTKIYWLSNKGPKIPIRIKNIQDAKGEILTDLQPYGWNNTLLKISLRIEIEATFLTMFHEYSYQKEMVLPIVVQLIQGNVDSYLPYQQTKQ